MKSNMPGAHHETLPDTYIRDTYLANLMADAEYSKFKDAVNEANDGFKVEAEKLFEEVNEAGVDAAEIYFNALDKVYIEETGMPNSDCYDMRRQVDAGKSVTSSQVMRAILDL